MKRMNKLEDREHNFSSKLIQESLFPRVKEYIAWQRHAHDRGGYSPTPQFGPVSINLDLTSACNFACPHCVDSGIINTGEYVRLDSVRRMIDVLQSHGLLSIILVGGGEPTLHHDFEKVVEYIKGKGVDLGIVTNGARLDRIARIAPLLDEKDWLRISIDAGTEETFRKAHRPRTKVTLHDIVRQAGIIKRDNPSMSLGYSFVIVWDGIVINGNTLCRNVHEMAQAVELAKANSFDYVSFKPCLVRLETSQKESLMESVRQEREGEIIADIQENLKKARHIADGDMKILESVNLRAMLNEGLQEIKHQPKRCHMQFFRTVVTPSGIFHCPAFRGVSKAKIAEGDGYANEHTFSESLEAVRYSIGSFDAEGECKVVACFYHHVNWWLESLIDSHGDVEELQPIEDDNFFL